MVYSKNYSWFFHLLGGQCSMEIAVLLLLTVPLTTASPLRSTHSRSDADTIHPVDNVQPSGVKMAEEHVPALRIITFHSEDKPLDLDALKHSDSMSWKPRLRRTAHQGCQLGTCQLHNLANALFNFSKTSGKEESKKASDPQGYGR